MMWGNLQLARRRADAVCALGVRTIVCCALFGLTRPIDAQIQSTSADFELPGTQPGSLGVNTIQDSNSCAQCHANFDPLTEPMFHWRGSLKAHSARDPFFRAALAVANQDAPSMGRHCLRCHVPAAFLNDHLTPPDGTAFDALDLDGISCDICHRMVDPVDAGGVSPPEDDAILAALTDVPLHYGNAMTVIDSGNAKRGPFDAPAAPHAWINSPIHRSAHLCASCHNGGNPLLDRQPDDTYLFNIDGQSVTDEDPLAQMPLGRTFSEWLNSDFAAGGVDMGGRFGGNLDVVATCQDCHMPDTTGKGCSFPAAPARADLPTHEFSGAAAWVLDTLSVLYPADPDIDFAAVADGRARAVSMLQRAASLGLTVADGELTVRVTNETGHKLPTGHAPGRRMWINVKFFDAQDQLIGELGAYDAAGALLDEPSTLVYELVTGLDAHGAATTGLAWGAGPHIAVNNSVLKDNRIPPRGFTNAAYDAAGAPILGHAYPDGQYWDDFIAPIPADTTRLVASLLYQPASRSIIEDLQTLNTSDTWGDDLHAAWLATGKAAPETMASAELQVNLPPTATTLRINAGGLAYTDTQSRSWIADRWFVAGNPTSTAAAIEDTDDDVLYQSARTWACGDSFGYRIPVIPGDYLVSLHFSENKTSTLRGDRVFDLWIGPHQVLRRFDISSEIGINTAAVRSFVSRADDGWVSICPLRIAGDALISAIEIVPAQAGPRLAVFDDPFQLGTTALGMDLSRTLRVHSIGTDPVTVSALTLAGAEPARFALTAPGLPATVAPGRTLSVVVTLSPDVADGVHSADLQITSDDVDQSVTTVTLSGTVTSGLLPLKFDETILTSDVPFPTTLCLGPGPNGETDGRLYAGSVDGTIRVLTLDADRNVTGSQSFTTIKESQNYNEDGTPVALDKRQLTGILLDPLSTPQAPVLYVTHSDPRIIANTEPEDCPTNTRSGVFTRLVGPDFDNPANRVDLLVGLPRSRENHAPNGMQLAAGLPGERWLYVGIGGGTNYGAPSLWFCRMEEVPFSAAVIRYNVESTQSLAEKTITLVDPTIDALNPPVGVDAHAQLSDQIAGVVEIFATGFRNPYDLALHSNGHLYAADNEGNTGLGGTPEGPGAVPPAISLGTRPDLLKRAVQGGYAGHPNPSRNEYTWGDGTAYEPDQPTPPNFVPPVHVIGDQTATTGLLEYTANTFDGRMQGDLIAVNYAVGQNAVRMKLAGDGLTVTDSAELFGGLQNPLDVAADSAGRLYIAHVMNSGAISLFTPVPFLDPDDIDGDGAANAVDADDDADGAADADEAAAGSDPWNPLDVPLDTDADGVPDAADPDDDGDGLADGADQLGLDAQNGAAVVLPVSLNWDSEFLANAGVSGTGFGGAMLSSGGGGHEPSAIRLRPDGGVMEIAATAGTMTGSANDQENALQVGVPAGEGAAFTVGARVVVFGEGVSLDGQAAAGVYFGLGEDDFVRLSLTADLGGGQAGQSGLQLARETGGVFEADPSAGNVALALPAGELADLYLTLDPVARTATGKYRLNSSFNADLQTVGTVSVPASWFVTGAGANPGPASNGAVAGVLATRAGATVTTLPVIFDWFRVESGSVPADEAAAESAVVQRINCGAGAFEDTSGRIWSSDAFFDSGTTHSMGRPIFGTLDDEGFQSARVATDGVAPIVYTFNVPRGYYDVGLSFAETEFGGGVGGVGSRVFDVEIQGDLVEPGLDILVEAGEADRALRRTHSAFVDSSGVLTVEFVSQTGLAMVSGIEVRAGLSASDFNLDGEVNLQDFATFANCFNVVPGVTGVGSCPAETAFRCDLSDDCRVNLVDFATFATAFGL